MAPAIVAAGAVVLAADIAETVLIQIVGQAVSSVIGAVFAPELLELQQESFRLVHTRALDPAISIDSYIKGHRSLADSQHDLLNAGYAVELWQTMADSAGEPPPLDLLAEAWRRKIVPQSGSGPTAVSLEQGIRESRLKNKWIPIIEAMQWRLPDPAVVIEGWLRAQITEPAAKAYLAQAGITAETADLWYKSSGRPPGPMELIELARRGVIPEAGEGGDTLSLRQGFLETDLKNKWYEPWKRLLEYIPPPRTITALQRAGAITDARASELYKANGLSAELIAEYNLTAHHERSATTRELTKAELAGLYVDQAITAAELEKRLIAKGYSAQDAAAELELADIKVERALEQRAVNRVGTLYVGRKIAKAAALTSLDSLGMPAAQRDRLLKIWDLERGDNLRHLTPTEIGWAVKNGLLDVNEGLAELGNLGLGGRDAWLVLAYELKADPGVPMPTDNLPPA